jgi:hypothetical protein
VNLRRVATALGVSAAMVLVIAALVPRSYLANDDIGFIEYLRKNMATPWISPILVRVFGFAYKEAPGVPWYGLYQYGVIVATGAVLIHTCIELVDHRPGPGRVATLLGAMVIGASNAILAVGITWTTVSISALGTAVAAFVAHAKICQAGRKPVSWPRTLAYGLLLVSGYMLRPQGLGAMAVALLPLLGWTAVRFARSRYVPRLGALIALFAPIAIAIAVQNRIPQARGAERSDFDEFNSERGRLHGNTAYDRLDKRAPELLVRAGWTLDEYRDFMSWLIIDENDFPLEKMRRLIDTGGAPEVVTLASSRRQLRAIFDDAAASILLFASAVIAGVVLAWLGVIERQRGLAFSLGYLVFLIGVPLWMSARYRFPQRVSLSFYTVAALGLFIYLAREIADRPADPVMGPARDRRATVALVVAAVFLFGWARHLIAWIDRDPPPYRDELQALETRVAARKGFVFVYVQTGLVEFDPLRAEPRSYDGLQGGWGTFSAAWYETIARLGVHRGADVLGAMIDRPGAYLLAPRGARDWIRRKVANPSVRLALVDGAAIPGGGRPELYHLVTRPLVRGSDEWRMLERDEWAMNEELPGPPSVVDLAFRSIAFAAPYEQHLSPLRQPASGIALAPIDGGLRCTVTGDPGGCTVTGGGGEHAGLHVPVNGLRAVRFEVTLIDPENIVGFNVYAETRTSRSIRWRWELGRGAQQFGFTGAFTLVPGYSAHRLQLAVNTARLRDIRDLHIFVAVKPGTHAGFELRHLEVAEP